MFCLNYYPFQDYLNAADELKILYNPGDRTLQDFLEKYKDKTIVIDISLTQFSETDAQLMQGLSNKYGNIKVIFDYRNKYIFDLVKSYNIPYFFINHITTIDELTGLLEYAPSDMYICEELGFNIDKVSAILHEHNIKVRVYPNICQSSFEKTPSLKTFFIRPEDIDAYSTFVDVFELISDESRQELLFKVYKQGKWFGKINEVIPSFDDELSSRYLLPQFGLIRTRCGKRCMYKPGTCNICERFCDLADTMQESNIIVRKADKPH